MDATTNAVSSFSTTPPLPHAFILGPTPPLPPSDVGKALKNYAYFGIVLTAATKF